MRANIQGFNSVVLSQYLGFVGPVFEDPHKDRVYVRALIGVSVHVLCASALYRVILRKKLENFFSKEDPLLLWVQRPLVFVEARFLMSFPIVLLSKSGPTFMCVHTMTCEPMCQQVFFFMSFLICLLFPSNWWSGCLVREASSSWEVPHWKGSQSGRELSPMGGDDPNRKSSVIMGPPHVYKCQAKNPTRKMAD